MYLVQVGRVYFCAVFNAGIVTGVLRVTKRANGSNLFRRVSRPFAFCNFTLVRTIRYTLFIRYDSLLALKMHTALFFKDIRCVENISSYSILKLHSTYSKL